MERKLTLPALDVREFPDYCNKTDSRSNSCSGQCQRLTIDRDVRTRIEQLVNPAHLRLTPHYHRVLEEMAAQVKGHYDVIMVTGASDNHYLTSQVLIKNLHEKVFPHLRNFTLIYYNLGLNATNRAQLVKHCRCQVVDFPFSKFPKFFENLVCYTWKPVIIKAHIRQSNILLWIDTSVQFNKGPKVFDQLLQQTNTRGLQLGASLSSHFAPRTLPSTFHYFGEEACVYMGRGEIKATYGFYKKEFFVERLILEPWAACAVSRQCMCPVPYPERRAARSQENVRLWQQGKEPLTYGLAHRFDQSVLNLLVMKVYRERYRDLLANNDFIHVTPDEKIIYFPD